MAEGEQVVAMMGQMSIEAAKLLAAAISRIFEEIMARTRADYRLQVINKDRARAIWNDEKEQMAFDKKISEGGFLKDFENLKKHQDPKDPFVAIGNNMTEEEAHNVMEMAKGESIPYAVIAAGQKNEYGQDTYFIMARQSDMPKVQSMFEKEIYNARLREIENVIKNTDTSLQVKKTELAQLESDPMRFDSANPADVQARIVQLRKEIAVNTLFIAQMSAEYKLAKSAQTYIMNKIRLGTIVENLKQQYQDKAEIQAIDDDIADTTKKLNALTVENESLKTEISNLEISDNELSDDDKKALSAMKSKLDDNNAKAESLQAKSAELVNKRETVLMRQEERKFAAMKAEVNGNKFQFKTEPLNFDAAINRMTDRTVGGGDRLQHYFLLDKDDPSKYIECNAVNDTVDNVEYMKTTYTVYSNGKVVQEVNDGRKSGESKEEHNKAWARMRGNIQSSNGFSDNILFCETAQELEKYQEAIRNGQDVAQSKVEGFGRKESEQKDVMDMIEVDERNYDKRIEELTAELEERGCVCQLDDNLDSGVLIDLETGLPSEDIESVLISKQIVICSQLRKVTAEIAKEIVNTFIPMKAVQAESEKKLTVLKETKKELLETEKALDADRVDLTTAKAAEKANEDIFDNVAWEHKHETSMESEMDNSERNGVSLEKDTPQNEEELDYQEPKLENRTPKQIGKDIDKAREKSGENKEPSDKANTQSKTKDKVGR